MNAGQVYKHFQSETISLVPFMFGNPTICTSNLDVARQVAVGGQNTGFCKPHAASRAVLYVMSETFFGLLSLTCVRFYSTWGMNLFAADGETWRKHRRIIGPAFDNDLWVTFGVV
jgi:cytochrome P450